MSLWGRALAGGKALWLAWRRPTLDPAFRMARCWSNRELEKYADLFTGVIFNVSAGMDKDKEGRTYQEYFSSATQYRKTNFFHDREATDGEIFLDLECPLSPELAGIADVVFNHTTLEHIFNCREAFKTLCTLSKDVVIVVVPFLQQMHGLINYNDYWRFTPEVMKKMYEENGLKLRYCSNNSNGYSSIYIFCIGYRDKKWDQLIFENMQGFMGAEGQRLDQLVGAKMCTNSLLRRFIHYKDCIK